MGIEQSISRIVNQGENMMAGGGSPQSGFMASPNMLSVARQNPSLGGGQLSGSTVAGSMPGAPNTNRLAQMANPQSGGGGIGSQLGVPIGTALGFLQGGPKGALRGAMASGMDTAAAMSGNPGLAAMTPIAMQAMGMGAQQSEQPPPTPMQRPMPPPQNPQMTMPQPLPPIARQAPPPTGTLGVARNLPPQVLAMLGLG